MEVYIGSIWSFGFNFAPYGFMLCQGQLLSIAEYQALFALIGTTYGGDGMTTFALPDLRGRMPVGTGQGPGLSNYVIGQASGTESVTLTSANLAPHTHTATAAIPVGTATDGGNPVNSYFGTSDSDTGATYLGATDGTHMGMNAVGMSSVTGGNQPFNILNPYLTINYSIAVEGIFPMRN